MYFKSLEAKYRHIRTTFNESIVCVQLHVISILYGKPKQKLFMLLSTKAFKTVYPMKELSSTRKCFIIFSDL